MSSGFLDKISSLVGISDKRVLAGSGLAAVLLIGGGIWYFTQGPSAKDDETVAAASVDPDNCVPKTSVAVTDDDFIIGDKNAPVTLVEYLSQTCSACAQFRASEVPKIKETFVNSGKLRIVFRELHRNNVDVAASVLGRCLGREGFLPFTDMLLENQPAWLMREDNDVVAGLREMARRAGMSSEDFETCLQKQDEATKLAKASQSAAQDYCMTGTPTLLLNGRKLEGREIAYENLDAAIRAELKKAGVEEPPVPAAETGTTQADDTQPASVEGEVAPGDAAPAEGAPPSP